MPGESYFLLIFFMFSLIFYPVSYPILAGTILTKWEKKLSAIAIAIFLSLVFSSYISYATRSQVKSLTTPVSVSID